MFKRAVASVTAGMYETYDVLVEGIVATRYKRLVATRLPSPTTPALVDGYHGPVNANSSMRPIAFVVDNGLAAKIIEIAGVFNLTVAAVNQTSHVVVCVLVTGVNFRDPIQYDFVQTSKAPLFGGSPRSTPPPCLGG